MFDLESLPRDSVSRELITRECAGCGRTNVDLSPEAVAALVDEIPISPKLKIRADVYEKRLALCSSCDALREGVLCAHCGCFVRFRARARLFACPHPGGAKWPAEPMESEESDFTE